MSLMLNDGERLREYIDKASEQLADSWKADKELTRKALLELSEEDFIEIFPPQSESVPAQTLCGNRSDHTMISRKPGNVIVNLRHDPKKATQTVCSFIGTAAGIHAQTPPFLIFAAVVSALVGGSDLWELKISVNGAAVISSLQSRGVGRNFSATEQACLTDANALLRANGYDLMNAAAFGRELNALCDARCVTIENGIVILRERIVGQF